MICLKDWSVNSQKIYSVAHDGEYDGLYASIDTLIIELCKLNVCSSGAGSTRVWDHAYAKGNQRPYSLL